MPRCVLRLSGGFTVKLSRFFVVWWSRGKSLAFSVVWWFCGKSLAFSVVWWLRGKFLKCSLVRRPQRKVSSCFRVRPLLARCARSPGVFRCAVVLPAVFRCFLERLTPPAAHSKAFGAPFWPPGCLPGASWGPLGRHPGLKSGQERPKSAQKAHQERPRAPQERPKRPQAAPSDSELYF